MFTVIGIKDVIDIFLVSLILYYVYRVMRMSGTIKIFVGIIAFILIWILVSRIMEMRLLGSIMDKLLNVGVIILVILFQDDIRIFLSELGSHKSWKKITSLFRSKKADSTEVPEYIMHIVYAAKNMSQSRTGALIVIKRDMALVKYETTGEKINADIEPRLIETIFYKGTPLHDGAIILDDKKIVAAGCILPVSHAPNIPRELGLRHRSALGITQETDAMAVVVSEERGEISFAMSGKIWRNLSTQSLERLLSSGKTNN